MMNDKSTSPPVYLDTCVISGYVKEDMEPSDNDAFKKIVNMSQSKELLLCTSTVAKEEIKRLPIKYQTTHIEMYNTLQILKGSVTVWIDDDPKSTGYGNSVDDPDYLMLHKILPDENDARHLFQAKKAGVHNFITVDSRTILSSAEELENQCCLNVVSPSEFITKFNV